MRTGDTSTALSGAVELTSIGVAVNESVKEVTGIALEKEREMVKRMTTSEVEGDIVAIGGGKSQKDSDRPYARTFLFETKGAH
jgi:hypothetical protein